MLHAEASTRRGSLRFERLQILLFLFLLTLLLMASIMSVKNTAHPDPLSIAGLGMFCPF